MSPSQKLLVMFASAFSSFRDFFVFLGFIFFLVTASLRFHEIKLRVQVLRPASGRSRAAHVEPCHWSEGHHNYVGVSLQERRATMQVMLGVSLRARWDATLVI